MRTRFAIHVFLFLLTTATTTAAQVGIRETPHNLSVLGVGAPPSDVPGGVCVYCHTPHRARTSRALWNRDLPLKVYNLYSSSTLEASPMQPTGASRLCLSCHDGTTALATVSLSRPASDRGTNRRGLGTDLSDDHPISFTYDAELARQQGQLMDPTMLPDAIHLDASAQMQCTSCHEPHSGRYPNFLRVDDREGALCVTCHRQREWPRSSHALSQARWNGTGTNPWPDSPYQTVADNACNSCHQSHGASQPQRLLRVAPGRGLCLSCHDGSVATLDLTREFKKISTHGPFLTQSGHDPREDPGSMARHVTCTDCHNPHVSSPDGASAPTIPGVTRDVAGVNISGGFVPNAANEYEVCLKCHDERDFFSNSRLTRWDDVRNIRMQIDPSNTSYHPIVTTGKNRRGMSLRPGYSAWSIIYCTDCHNNDEWAISGGSPRGPHGSRYEPILEREYRTDAFERESYQAYEMCYKCHDRNHLLQDRIGASFSHRSHLTGRSPASCTVCHDAHGSRNYPALLNFVMTDANGRSIVRGVMDPSSRIERQPEYVTSGPDEGKCYLTCHGQKHTPL